MATLIARHAIPVIPLPPAPFRLRSYRDRMNCSRSFCIFRKSGGLTYIMCPASYSAYVMLPRYGRIEIQMVDVVANAVHGARQIASAVEHQHAKMRILVHFGGEFLRHAARNPSRRPERPRADELSIP